MLAQFFQVRTSGVGFFEELNKVARQSGAALQPARADARLPVLGFEGQYRGAAGGDGELQRIRRDVYQTLRHVKARTDDEISPRWRGMTLRMQDLASQDPALGHRQRRRRWCWSACSSCCASCSATMPTRWPTGWSRCTPSAAIDDRARPEFKTYQAPVVSEHRRSSSASAQRSPTRSRPAAWRSSRSATRSSSASAILLLFASGKADTKKEFEPAGAKIAAALDKEPGPIHVIGHTDNVKPKVSSAFKSNFDLSVARAKSVEAVLGKSLTDPTRIQVEGKGELEPIGDNKTADGRAQNRRVEIMIPKEETLQQTAEAQE